MVFGEFGCVQLVEMIDFKRFNLTYGAEEGICAPPGEKIAIQ
jgi:hypothetical protein